MVFIFLLLFIRAFLSELHHQTLRMEEQQLCHWAFIQQQIITMLKLISLEHIIFYAFTILNSALINFLKCTSLRIFFSAWLLAIDDFQFFLMDFSLFLSILWVCLFHWDTHAHDFFHRFLFWDITRTYPVSKKLVQLIYGICGWHIKQITKLGH